MNVYEWRLNRRRFSGVAAALMGQGLMSAGLRLHGEAARELDRFGGWKGKRFEATGFFRVEKDERWWLVTPDGHAFLSFGINHLHSDLWKQDYNRKAWQEHLGLDDLADNDRFAPALRSWFLKACADFGFNTIGVHTSLPVVNRPAPAMPYMQPIRFVDIPHWRTDVPDENFLDVFSSRFSDRCDRLAKSVAEPVRNDPFLLGYSMTDCPLLTEEDCRERPDVIGGARRPARMGWPRRLRNLGSSAPGKIAYVEVMRQLYGGQVQAFNGTYGTSFGSFDALLSAEGWRLHTDLSNVNETRDNTAFLHAVVDRYYQTTRDAIRRYDPNHLFVGDKLNANTDSLDSVLPVTAKYTDIILYQMYGRYEVQEPGLDRWYQRVGKPMINGDSAFTMIADTMPRPYGPVADSLEQRAEWTNEFFRKAFARPDFVGWHYCGLIDAPNRIPRKQARQHSGLMDGFGKPYPQLQEIIQRASSDLYDIATVGLRR